MKIKFFLICFCFCYFAQGQIKSVEVLYRINPLISNKQREAKLKRLPVSLRNRLKEMLLVRDGLVFGLTINGNESFFYLDMDKVSKFSNLNGYNENLSSFGSSYFFKNSNTKEILERKIADKDYIISSNQSKYNWKLHDESKKIGNYLCFKATTIKRVKDLRGLHEKKVEAWYCPELSFSTGPKDYGNLPGLILELKEDDLIYFAFNVSFKNDTRDLKKIFVGNQITEEDYFKTIPTMTKENIREYIGN